MNIMPTDAMSQVLPQVISWYDIDYFILVNYIVFLILATWAMFASSE